MPFFTALPNIASVLIVVSYALCTARAQVPPSQAAKFLPALMQSKLQSPTPETVIYDVIGYASDNFQLIDDTYMQFRMSGKLRRTELRQMDLTGDDAYWSVADYHNMRAVVVIPDQDPEMEAFVFMQVLCSDGDGSHIPAVKIEWSSEDGQARISANIRSGTGSDDINGYELFSHDVAAREVIVEVNDSKVNIFYEGYNVLSDVSLSFFEDYDKGCYFKAGVYVQAPDDESVHALANFVELLW